MVTKEYDRAYACRASIMRVEDDVASPYEDPANIVIHREQTEVIRKCFYALPPESQAIVDMRLQDSLTCRECAEIIGRS